MSRATAFSLVVLAASVALLAHQPARAETPNARAIPLYVLSIWTNDADDQADALTQTLRARVRQMPGWSLMETNQSFETLAIALRGPPTPDPLCLERIGDQLHADHYVWGTLAKERAGEVSADLRLWTRGKPQVEVNESYAESLKEANEPALREVASRLLTRLTSPGEVGTLIVHAGSGTGTVLVDGVKKSALDRGVARVQLPGGAHTVAVHVSGFDAPAQTANVRAGAVEDVSFTLSPSEGEPRTDEVEGTGAIPTRKVVGYAAIVAGAGFLVAAGVEALNWLHDKSASDSDRTDVPSNVTDVCLQPLNAAAQDACEKSKDAASASTLGWIFAGTGAVVAGTGIWLVMTSPHGSADGTHESAALRTTPRKLQVLPVIGTRGGALHVRAAF